MNNGLFYNNIKLSKIGDLGPLLGNVGSRCFDCVFVDKDGIETKITTTRLDDFGKWFNTRISFEDIHEFAKRNNIPMIFYSILPELTMLENYDEAVAMNLLVYQMRFVRTVSQSQPLLNQLAVKLHDKIYNLTNVTETALLISDLADYYFEQGKFPSMDTKLVSNVLCNLKGFNLELGGLDFPGFLKVPARMHLDPEGLPIF